MQLTRANLAWRAAAEQRSERLVPRPDSLSAKARRAASTRLLRAGAEEVADEPPGWRGEAQAAIGPRITTADLARLDPREAPLT